MNRIACRITDDLLKQNIITKADYEIYHYGVISGLELVFFLVFNLLIAFCAGWTEEFVVFILIFAPLRSFTGGIHMKHYASCFVCTTLLIQLVLAAAAYSIAPVSVLLICYLLCVTAILASLKKQAKEQTREESLYYQEKILQILFFTFIGFMVFLLFKKYELVHVLVGVLGISVFSLLPAWLKKEDHC